MSNTRCFQVSLALIALAIAAMGSNTAWAEHHEAIRYVLTDSATNQHADEFTLSSSDMPFDSAAPWSITKTTLKGGKQDGVDLITVDNGSITIVVIPTRGMNIYEVVKGDVRLGWNSPVKEIVHPKYINLDTRGGLGWLDGFNEWMVRCGLEFAGGPTTDSYITEDGATVEQDVTLHGKIGNIPASQVEILIDKAAPHRIRVRGVVHETMFHGPNLRLVAEVSTEPGSDTWRIDDSITNDGALNQEFQIIYHGNFGVPLLEEGSLLEVATKSVTPQTAHAATDVDTYDHYRGPMAGFPEQVYLIEPYADASGNCVALLSNAARDLGASISWPHAQMPYLTQWKNPDATENGYVTGIEPATGYPFNRRVERKFGRVPKLEPGQSRQFTLDFTILEGKKAVEATSKQIKKIQGKRDLTIIKDPPNTD
jgi:hypothetical protein